MQWKILYLHIFFVFTFISICSSRNEEWLNYPELNRVPDICKPESCSDTDRRIGKRRPCDCDERCTYYGTCCIDSPYTNGIQSKPFRKHEHCSQIHGSTDAAFMVCSCNPRWRGQLLIRALCERINPNEGDPLALIPVTNPKTNITYRNYFCSLCNFNHESDSVLWEVLLIFEHESPGPVNKDVREDIIRRLEYNGTKWGIWNTGINNSMEFRPVTISPQVPFSVKTCETNLESRCDKMWNDDTVRRLCQSYLSPITLPVREGNSYSNVKFRNIHCAICNYLTEFKEEYCVVSFSFAPPSLSFSLLLDVNPSDGDKVGEINPCERNEVYDPFFKKCRALVCALPGYVVKNGQCTKT